jgi:inositol hexakisphosphate/diphosphoinositol-pentakisphosphate kinase
MRPFTADFSPCSLVKKDAGMLDAFGKGASEDIRAAKAELYAQMTWDPLTSQSLNAPPQIATPLPSPPPSPKLETAASDGNSGWCA